MTFSTIAVLALEHDSRAAARPSVLRDRRVAARLARDPGRLRARAWHTGVPAGAGAGRPGLPSRATGSVLSLQCGRASYARAGDGADHSPAVGAVPLRRATVRLSTWTAWGASNGSASHPVYARKPPF